MDPPDDAHESGKSTDLRFVSEVSVGGCSDVMNQSEIMVGLVLAPASMETVVYRLQIHINAARLSRHLSLSDFSIPADFISISQTETKNIKLNIFP